MTETQKIEKFIEKRINYDVEVEVTTINENIVAIIKFENGFVYNLYTYCSFLSFVVQNEIGFDIISDRLTMEFGAIESRMKSHRNSRYSHVTYVSEMPSYYGDYIIDSTLPTSEEYRIVRSDNTTFAVPVWGGDL